LAILGLAAITSWASLLSNLSWHRVTRVWAHMQGSCRPHRFQQTFFTFVECLVLVIFAFTCAKTHTSLVTYCSGDFAQWRYLYDPTAETNAKLRVLLVQANIGNFEKFLAEKDNDFRTPIVQKHYELTRRGLNEHKDTISCLPETAFRPTCTHNSQEVFKASESIWRFTENHFTGGYLDDPAPITTLCL
jgi:apolipoprotein N-acyltransferase